MPPYLKPLEYKTLKIFVFYDSQDKINLQFRSFGMMNILLTLRNSKTRNPAECRDSEFERKSSLRDKCPLEVGVSRGGPGHAPLGNFKILYFGNVIFSILRGETK